MGPLKRLKAANGRLALLALLAVKGIKPVSRIDGYEGPEKTTGRLLKELGLEAEFKHAGCRADVVFGTPEGMNKYRAAAGLTGREKIRRLGLAFGYPDCCANFFADLVSGKTDGEPERKPPLEHFLCPGCKVSPGLLKKYSEMERRL